MYYFNLVDHDGESMGILQTNLLYDIVDLEWSMYCESETSNHCIEEFIELLNEAYSANHFERFFIDPIEVSQQNHNYKSKINLKNIT